MSENTDTRALIPVPIASLYVQCSFPERPDAPTASDTCQRIATSGVIDPETGGTYWRCAQHEGMVRVRPGYTPAVLLGRVVHEVLRSLDQTILTAQVTAVAPDSIRIPYVGHGVDGCLRSAEIDRNEIDTLPTGPHQEGWSEATEERRAELQRSVDAWEAQAKRAEDAAREPGAVVSIGPAHDGMRAVVYGARPFPFLAPEEIAQRAAPTTAGDEPYPTLRVTATLPLSVALYGDHGGPEYGAVSVDVDPEPGILVAIDDGGVDSGGQVRITADAALALAAGLIEAVRRA